MASITATHADQSCPPDRRANSSRRASAAITLTLTLMAGLVSGAHAQEPAPRELTVQELLSFQSVRAPGPGGRFFGHDEIGTYRGHRFVAEYICSDVCPDYTMTVYHFIDLKTVEDCTAIGATLEQRLVPRGIGIAPRSFCMPTHWMK